MADLAAVLAAAAERLAGDLTAVLRSPAVITAGEPVTGSAGALLPRVGPAVVAVERTLAGPVRGTFLVLCAAADAAQFAALAAGRAPAADPFDLDRDREPLTAVFDAAARCATAVLLPAGAPSPAAPLVPKVFALDQDLNRAVSFLGDGDLAGVRFTVSQPPASGAPPALWVLARPDLAAAYAAANPQPRTAPPAPQDVADAPDLRRILAISVPVIVTLAEKKMLLKDILALVVGKVLDFDKSAEDFLELCVNNRVIGRGEAVKVGDKFGLRILEIGDVKDTLRKLGQAPPPVV
jgi:flagellar motor switch protein FliN/FliY